MNLWLCLPHAARLAVWHGTVFGDTPTTSGRVFAKTTIEILKLPLLLVHSTLLAGASAVYHAVITEKFEFAVAHRRLELCVAQDAVRCW